MVLNWNDVTDIEEFNGVRQKGCTAFIRIDRQKLIAFSSGFVKENKDIFANCNFLKLAFSQKTNAILIFFTNKEEEFKTLKITKTYANKNQPYPRYTFSVASFLKRFEINNKNPKLAGAYSIQKINHPSEKYCFAICLNEKYE